MPVFFKAIFAFGFLMILGSSAVRADEISNVSVYRLCNDNAGLTVQVSGSVGEALFKHLRVAETRDALRSKRGLNVVCEQTPPLSEFWDGPNHVCTLALTGAYEPRELPRAVDGTCEEDWVRVDPDAGVLSLRLRGAPARKILRGLNGGAAPEIRAVFKAGVVECRNYRVIVPGKFFRPRREECVLKLDALGRLLSR